MSSAYSSGGSGPLLPKAGQVQLLPTLHWSHHLCLKVIDEEAKEGGAQGAALIEADSGLEAGGGAVGGAHTDMGTSA